MKIRNKLYLNFALTLGLVVALITVILITSRAITRKDAQRAVSQEILQAVSELDILTYEFLLRQEPRAKAQWHSRFATLGRRLLEAGTMTGEERGLVDRLSANARVLGTSFGSVVEHYEQKSQRDLEAPHPREAETSAVLRERLVARLLIASQAMISDAGLLERTCASDLLRIQRWARDLTLLFAMFLLLNALATWWTITRSTAGSLQRLHAGTGRIGQGDLDHRIEVREDNEFGQLSEAFNQMTRDLQAVTVSKRELEAEILERRKAEEALRLSEEKYRIIFETANEGIWITDRSAKTVLVNQRMADLLGYPMENLLGRMPAEFLCEGQEQILLEVRNALQAGAKTNQEFRFRCKDGSELWALSSASPVLDETGLMVQATSMLVDITGRKQAEEALHHTLGDLERQVQERTATLRERSDKLRALASELTLAEQRERQRLAQLLHDGLQQVLVGAKFRMNLIERAEDEGIRQMAREVNELLSDSIEMSRSLTAELSPPILREAGLVPALEWLARWMREKHGLAVNLVAQGETGPLGQDLTILSFQATRELLFNVVKHAGIQTAHISVLRTDGTIRITVADRGVGFDPAGLHQADGRPGGFGLFSIRERVELIGGSMRIESSPGTGSRFELRVPCLSPAEEEPQTDGLPRISVVIRPNRKADRVAAGRIRVVLVDDHLVMRQGLTELLRNEVDLAVVGEASDGESAVRLVREVRPDVVLMDISMPGMNGIEATRVIHAELPEVRIIGLSMFEEADQAARMREAGASCYLTKSGPSTAVIAAIRAETGRPPQLIALSGDKGTDCGDIP